jgi:hypothetical protein
MFVPDDEVLDQVVKVSARCECQQSCSTLEHMGKGHEVEIQFPRDAVAALRQEYDRVHLTADDRMFEGSVRRRFRHFP